MRSNFLKGLLEVAIKIVSALMPVISAELRDLLISFAQTLKEKAEKTPNAFDDVLVDLLYQLFDIK